MFTLPNHRAIRPTISMALVTLLVACGGGNSSSESGSSSSSSPTTGTTPPPTNTTPTTPPNTGPSALSQALSSGNSKDVSQTDLLSSTRNLLAAQNTAYANAKAALFNLNLDGSAKANSVTGVNWNPTHDSSYFNVLDAGRIQVILPTNWQYTGTPKAGNNVALGVVGTALPSGTRFAAFGGDPIGVRGNAAMDNVVANTISWLTPRSSQTDFKVVTAHLPGTETYWFPHENRWRDWLTTRYAGVTINGKPGSDKTQVDNTCDGTALDTCLQGADLLIIGREEGPKGYDGDTVMKAVTSAQARGIPVLLAYHYRDAGDLATRLLSYFGLGQVNNYWNIEGVKDWNPSTLGTLPPQLEGIADLLTRLEKGTFSSTWSGCDSDRLACSGDATYQNEFGRIAGNLRSTLRGLDAAGTSIFSQSGYALEKHLVLLGDKYREAVSYPLDKVANKQDFVRALFSDVTAYVHRPYSAVAKNLGNFSGNIPASTPAISRTVTVPLPSDGSKDYITGLYVMPGRAVTITRTDSSTASLSFGLNMLRNTTWAFDSSGLLRPTQITSPRMPLAAGQSVTITSPYGGPLMLFIGSSSGPNQSITVKVDGTTTHPVLRDANDAAQITAFKTEIENTPTNWVAISSDTLTLHSLLPYFKTTMKNYGGDLNKFSADTWTYVIKDIYELAGFNSASGKYVLTDSVKAFCTTKGWDCTGTQHRRDMMQHVIVDDRAQCGSGCSGNPYDQDWPFDPMGWGESHEIGHNLQRSRLKIYDGMSGEVSNNIFPTHKWIRVNQEVKPSSPYQSSTGTIKDMFNTMMNARTTTDPTAAVKTAIWSDNTYAANNSQRVAFYRQLTDYARYYNKNFVDGWELYTLMYLLDRNLDAKASSWSSVSASYGMGTYSSAPTGMSGNDFMLVSSSYIIGRDMRPVFDLWGVTYTAEAAAQVSAYGFPAAQKFLFPMNYLSVAPSGVGAPVEIKAGATYPTGY